MSFLVNAVQSALTPSGTNAAKAEQQNQSGIGNDASSLFKQLEPSLESEIGYANSNVAGDQAAQNRLQLLNSPGNIAARQQQFANNARSQAATGAAQADDEDQASGLSDAYQAGQNQAISNQATNAIDQYQAQVNSPEYQLAAGNAALGAYANAVGNLPSLGSLGQLSSMVYGQPTITVQPGLGSMLGAIAGDYTSGALGKETAKDTDNGDDD